MALTHVVMLYFRFSDSVTTAQFFPRLQEYTQPVLMSMSAWHLRDLIADALFLPMVVSS